MPDPRSPENDATKPVKLPASAVDSTTPSGHYFNAAPTSKHHRRSVTVRLPDLQFDLQTNSGVFSPDQLDRGTKYLLQELPGLPPGPYLDLGCGYGPIAITLAKRYPGEQVWAVDVNQRALELTRGNADRLQVHVNVSHAEALAVEQPFGAIVSNPPIRIGKAALHSLLVKHLSLLRESDGVAYLVVHKHLGADSLTRWLNAQGYPSIKIGSRQGYRLLKVRCGTL